MVRSLLSIDWDYFIPVKREWLASYIENEKNIVSMWYKRYIESALKGEDLEKSVDTGLILKDFWSKIKKHFNFAKRIKVFVSESHRLSYYIAKNNECQEVYSFDAHSDLGYTGIDSAGFEPNCANWLGKLLSEGKIKRAHIIYSPYTLEKPEDFSHFNRAFEILYYRDIDCLPKGIYTAVIHICRSGAWTPPWLDCKFDEFIKELHLPFEVISLYKRNWDIKKLSLSEQIFYLNFA
ncbi:hypothetical protein SAMN02746089_01638 [Caldanaerobius fijiensis DSM 17918]|uniref:Arginase family protein n=1 Tax=Caldanaerobius fijiensis DSM 17918 TaxID=1121256 RepID=A0A1M5AGV4_9THEO|nr:arginase [Caldanaerobius fijiensis]SHF29376.1 hypothetical protein SAMN02746089_01638 [Caldanaerobius fijiensis DSM 17918]